MQASALLLIGILVAIVVALVLLRRPQEGFTGDIAAFMKFGKKQATYFFDQAQQGIFTNPGLDLSGSAGLLADALGTVDSDMAVTMDPDYSKYFMMNPEFDFLEAQRKFCDAAEPRLMSTQRFGKRARCGWYFQPNADKISQGALGTSSGPLLTGELEGGGQWIWNLQEAQKKEDLKRCAQITTCEAIPAGCGFCQSSGKAIPIQSNGTPKYPEDPAGTCSGVVRKNPGECVAPPNANVGGGAADGATGVPPAGPTAPVDACSVAAASNTMSVACLKSAAKQVGFSDQGAILRLLTTGAAPGETDKLAFSLLQTDGGVSVDATYYTTGAGLSVGEVFDKFRAIYTLMNNVHMKEQVRTAAKWLVRGGVELRACDFKPADAGPFPTSCLQREFRRVGCQAGGLKYPSDRTAVSDFANMSWKQVTDLFTGFKAGTQSADPAAQDTALKNCLGNGAQFYLHSFLKHDSTF